MNWTMSSEATDVLVCSILCRQDILQRVERVDNIFVTTQASLMFLVTYIHERFPTAARTFSQI